MLSRKWLVTSARTQFDLIDYLVIEANSGCNLACRSCNRKDLEAAGLRAPKKLKLTELDLILESFRNCPIKTIKFEWLSEPMLHPEFDILAARVREVFPDSHIIIATNLQYAPEKTALLRTLPWVDTVYLSIDGVEGTYEFLRAGAKYPRLLQALETLSLLVPAAVRSTKLHINFTLGHENAFQLPQIYELRERFGLASVRINFAQNWNEEGVGSTSYSDSEIAEVRRYLKDLKGVPGWTYEKCFWPFHGITIDVAGNIRQCIINTSQAPIGNLFTDNVREVFNHSQIYREAREKLNRNQAPKQCLACDYQNLSPLLEKVFADQSEIAAPVHTKVIA